MPVKRGLRFDKNQRRELEKIGLSKDQVRWLEHALPAIEHEADAGPTNNAVRAELESLHKHLVASAEWFNNSQCSPERRLAAATVGRVAHKVDRAAAGVDLEDMYALPRRIDAAVLSRLLLAVCEKALVERPKSVQKAKRAAFPTFAVQQVVDALWRPSEPARVESAATFHPVELSFDEPPMDVVAVVELLQQIQQGQRLVTSHRSLEGLALKPVQLVEVVRVVMEAIGKKDKDPVVAVQRYLRG